MIPKSCFKTIKRYIEPKYNVSAVNNIEILQIASNYI